MNSFCISATSSNSGKTILTTALLYYFKNSVRPYKIGPDYIDPQFHKVVCNTSSINLDSFIMDEKQVRWIYNHYNDKEVSILEGVMGFYDGENKGCSAYSITKLLDIPTILILDASGSYITISAILKGLLTYKENTTIKAIVLNNVSSQMHYKLIYEQISQDHKDISILGWIEKNIESLNNTHLGLDLEDISKIQTISKDVLKNIDLKLLKEITKTKKQENTDYPFLNIEKKDKNLAIVTNKYLSFLYKDNIEFLKQVFSSVIFINPSHNKTIPNNIDTIYICGGYVETKEAYDSLKDADIFKNSLKEFAKLKTIYAECAGLLYLGNKVDEKKMCGILDIDFVLDKKFDRLGYYYNSSNIKGHSFHYTKAVNLNDAFDTLSKTKLGKGKFGSWSKNKVFATYLHTMFRNNTSLIDKLF